VCEYLATFLRVKSSGDGGNKKTTDVDDLQLQGVQGAPELSPLLNEASNHQPKGSPSSPTSAASAAETEAEGQLISGVESLLVNIRDLLQTSVRTMAQLRHEKDENQRMMNDWIVAAAVIDRISFILITALFVVGTLALVVLSCIPHN